MCTIIDYAKKSKQRCHLRSELRKKKNVCSFHWFDWLLAPVFSRNKLANSIGEGGNRKNSMVKDNMQVVARHSG